MRRLLARLVVAVVVLSASLAVPAAPARAHSVCDTPYWLPYGQFICLWGMTEVEYDDRLHVFVVGTDYAVWHTWETSVNGPFARWTSLGGVARGPVTSWLGEQDGAKWIAINVLGTTHSMYCKWYNRPPVTGAWYPGRMIWQRC
jgi:hypothetical protein